MSPEKTILLPILFFFTLSSYAQYDQLVNKSYAERLEQLYPFYQDSLRFGDSVPIFKTIDRIKELATANKDDDLLMEASLLRAHYFFYRPKFAAGVVLPMLDSLRSQGVEGNKVWLMIRAENMTALYHFYVNHQYEVAFEHFYKMYDGLKQVTAAEFPLKQICLLQMAEVYYYFSDYYKAIDYLKEASSCTPGFEALAFHFVNILNTIGLCYQELRQLDSSDYYLNKAYRQALALKNRVWLGIASGNLGYNCFLRKEYDKAIPFFKKDIDIAIEYQDWGLASSSLMHLASISLERNDITKMEEQLQEARRYVYLSGQYKRLQTLYPLLSKFNAVKGNAALASLYLDSSIFVRDSLARKFNALLALRAQQKVEREQQKAEVANITSQKKIEILKRNILFAIAVLLMVLFVYIYRQQQKKQRLSREKLQKAEDDLKLATKQLDDFTRYISEKNNTIEMLQHKLNNDEQETWQQLQTRTILTDDEWEYFRQLFEKVHGGFLQRLKEKLPSLTPAEIRFMALSKLKFSNKEMAATLGVSPQAMRVTWHRLRKKLELPEESSIDELINSL